MSHRSAFSAALLCLVLTPQAIRAQTALPKQTLKPNGIVLHNEKAGETESFSGLFSDGIFYGRLRSNNFYFRWKTEDAKHAVQYVGAVGASFVFDSARYEGFDFGAGLYGSQAFFNESDDPVAALKPGKDTLSRYDFVNTGNKSMAVIAQAWLRYAGLEATEFIFGRQLVDTFYTKSNDTKMIPNTFDGLFVTTEAVADTRMRVGWFYEQKLRDHTQGHAVLMYGDANSSSHLMPQWSENDDSAMHRGLTYTALKAAGKPTDAPLITGDFRNTSVENLKIDAAFYVVPQLLSQVMGEVNYAIAAGEWTITPGARYIHQFDLGAGKVGGASYTGDAAGYDDPNSLESDMIGLRLLAEKGLYRFNLAFTQVLDEADLVTPWRGFPTAGYTRSMGVYNWRANTKSYRFEVKRNANGTGMYKTLFVQASLLYIDTDEGKKTGYHMFDEIYPYVGFVQNLPSLPALQWKLRLGYAHFLDSETADYDYLDSRFELNYLF